MWARRLMIGTGMAAVSLFVAPVAAHAADTGCYTNCTTPTIASNNGSPSLPFTAGPAQGPVTPASGEPSSPSSSLPFTGADVEELAVIGVGAVVVGGLLMRRRRSAV